MTAPYPQRQQPIPDEYAGKWIAWNRDETSIIANGETFEEACRAAATAGEQDPVLQKVPETDELFLGAVS